MKKIIALEKLNSLLVNIKADKAIKDFYVQNPGSIDSSNIETKIYLKRVVLRVSAINNVAGVPFYAFVKKADKMVAIVDVFSGSTQVIDPSIIASETDVKNDTFRIHGVTYGLQDVINGCKRYRPLSIEPSKPRQKMSLTDPEVTGACDALGL